MGPVSIGLGALISALAVSLVVLTAMTPGRVITRVLELALSLGVLIPGLTLIRAGTRAVRPVRIRILPGELLLAASLVYLGVAMPVFHAGGVSYGTGVGQFTAVLIGLWLGCAALALSGVTTSPDAEPTVSLKAALRDGVILIVGTILVAIALSQVGLNQLTPPKWNWISFLGITVPGMLILIGRELVKRAFRVHRPDRRVRAAGRVAIETLLIVGLVVMLYGSGANLILGGNGFTSPITGNSTGLAVLIAAAVFLAVIRGALKVAFMNPAGVSRSPRPSLAINVTYVLGLVVFIYGERSVVMGKSPLPVVGGAVLAAAIILVAGAVVLIADRMIVHRVPAGNLD